MSQTAKKWIKADAIDGTKIRLNNEENFRGRNALDTADLNIGKINSADVWEFGIEPNWGTYPTAGSSLVNKDYVHDVIAGLRDLKDACRIASTTNLSGYTASGFSGLGTSFTVDGVTAVNGDRILLKDQTTKLQNGIYEITGVGVAVNLIRAIDADDDAEVSQGMAVDIVEGLANGRTRWLLTTADPITVGTSQLVFVEVPNPSTIVQFKDEQFTLDGTDIANGYVDLSNDAETGSVLVYPDDGPPQRYASDYTVSLVSNVSRITFASDLATLLAATDVLIVKYAHYS